jgi:REP element-mobilizing transposase RayT
MTMKGSKIPHFDLRREPVHFFYRLNGSIPVSVLNNARDQRDDLIEKARLEAQKMPSGLAGQFLQLQHFEINALHELFLDDYLHGKSNGPYHLAQPELATIVLDSLLTLHEQEIVYVYAICVMSNHVHAILGVPDGKEFVAIGKLMKSHKGFTARMCNRVLAATGIPFWDDSYFDRTVRKGKFITVMAYVLNNPVKAGLVEHWSAWPHSWLNPEFELLFESVQ